MSDFQNNYRYIKNIGGGRFGTVNLYEDGNSMRWAVKEITTSGASLMLLEYIYNEVLAMQNINYNYILKAEKAYESDKKIMIVAKFAEHGTFLPSFL